MHGWKDPDSPMVMLLVFPLNYNNTRYCLKLGCTIMTPNTPKVSIYIISHALEDMKNEKDRYYSAST